MVGVPGWGEGAPTKKAKSPGAGILARKLEAPVRFELTMADLQSAALATWLRRLGAALTLMQRKGDMANSTQQLSSAKAPKPYSEFPVTEANLRMVCVAGRS